MFKKQFAAAWAAILILGLALPVLGAAPVDAKATFKGFAEFMAKALADFKVPGVAVAVVKDGQVILAEGFGLRDIKNNLKVTPQTVFAIGSSSKAFTAATVGILADDGKLEWDKPVREYLPTFKLWDDIAAAHMTPRDLLCHRSGLPRHDLMWYASPLSRQELFNRLAYLEPSREFRSFWQYQNLMIMTAGHLVGELTHSTWEEFTRKRIFDPLKMTSSSFSVEAMRAAADHSLGYGEKKDKVEELPYRNIDAIGPAGSINSNVTDMANWVLLNLNKGKFGGKTIVSEASLAQIQSPQMVIQDPTFMLLHNFPELTFPSYGMGWVVTSYRGHSLLHHGGNIDGFSAMVSLMPRDNMGLVVLTNLNGTMLPYAAMFNIYDRLLGLDQVPWSKRYTDLIVKMKGEAEKAKKEAGKDRRPDTKPSHPLEDYAGEYAHPAYGAVTFTKAGDGLQARFHDQEFAVGHYHYDIFELKDAKDPDGAAFKATFGMDAKGVLMTVALPLEPSVKEIVFTRMAEKKLSDKAFLAKLCGVYDLMGQAATVALRGESTLTIQVAGQPPVELVPAAGTSFSLKGVPGASLEFQLDASGTAVAAILSQGGGTFTAKKK
jgi:CubicO group peptidase (beta-lactamase class C family)